jgi:hypothetical protein
MNKSNKKKTEIKKKKSIFGLVERSIFFPVHALRWSSVDVEEAH